MPNKPVITILDIETAPKVAYVWRFFKENISPKQVQQHCRIMSFASKQLGEKDVFYADNRTEDDAPIVRKLIDVLDASDIVIAHNAWKFDLGTINARALVAGINPPSPYKVVDTLRVAKREFLFESNSLEYLADVLGCTSKFTKRKFPGFQLWTECLKGNPEAWEEMKVYNVQDVDTLEEIYLKMRPWIRNHPNIGVLAEGDKPVCPKCGSHHVHFRGYATTNVSKFRRFKCLDCGGWGRDRFNEYDKEKRNVLLTNVV